MTNSKPLIKKLKLPKLKYYETHLAICNAILPVKMLKKEMSVMAAFLSFEGDLAKDRFGTTARKMVMKQLNLTSGGLGNYLKSLKDKGFIVVGADGELSIWPLLFPNDKEQTYNFLLTKAESNGSH